MTNEDKSREGFSLRRWSDRKHAAAREKNEAPAKFEAHAPVPAAQPGPEPPIASSASAPSTPALPPVESLTPQSDFVPFMRPEVDESLKRAALKKLFGDPRFNVMDGLDVYIDDYSKPDPIEPELVKQLAHARYLFDPPKTRVNEQGIVEDVPPAVAEEKPAEPSEQQAGLEATEREELPAPGDSEKA
jgi:hypothetical protein